MKWYSLLIGALLCACTSQQSEEQAAPGTPDVQGEEVVYTANGDTLKGYLAYDRSTEAKRPGVLVVHEWWGHNEYARKRARMLAELGYVALAVDMYGKGLQAEHPDDASKFSSQVMQNITTGEKRFLAAMEYLKSQAVTDPQRIAAIGYCFGGGVVLHMARIGTDLRGVVSFHGALNSLHKPEPGNVKAKILVCHGGDDSFISQEVIDAFKQEMDEAGADYRFVVYEGAKHSFTNPDADTYAQKFGIAVGYNAEADQQSWQEMQNFFKEIFQ